MKYYISINSWNLLESFVTESLSPFAFYNKRNFGNNLSRYISSANDKINFLVLSTSDNGGDFSIEVDDSLLDEEAIKPVKNLKTLFTYGKTIYYKVGQVSFRFTNQSLLDAFIAETQILYEVKCIEKYKAYFNVKEVKEKKASITLQRLGESFSFEQQEYINKDNKFNLIKGAVVGYVLGELTASRSDEQKLISMIKDIKNSFAGLNTQIMVNDIEVQNPEMYIVKLRECKKLFYDICKERTNNFDILTQLFIEIKNLSSMRSEELALYKSEDWDLAYTKLVAKKQELESQICQIEIDNKIANIKEELKEIKKQEKLKGESQGKTRIYFKKGSPEYERKSQLKKKIEDFEVNNDQYKSLIRELNRINQRITDSISGRSQYDNVISALFSRVSDIVNDLQKKFDAGKSLNPVNLSPLKLTPNGTFLLNDSKSDIAEMDFFNILLRLIIGRESLEPISDTYILSLIVDAANNYKTFISSNSDAGVKILSCLRSYWKYKHNIISGFNIPEEMPILQSIMSFFLKPFGFDQIERYMLNKKFTEKKYALMLWAACNGYAALPKTFTSVLYQNRSNFIEMDDLLQVTYNSL